ncbi:PQQ-binding-like beta-propeller repeat protein [candidate division WOR-3 bacterium]|nr:PQQ-binding-like beta-propeller repeat protein [candidate division WOR-3 bacterium]
MRKHHFRAILFSAIIFFSGCSKSGNYIEDSGKFGSYTVAFYDSTGGDITSWEVSGDTALLVGNFSGRMTLFSISDGRILRDTFFDSPVLNVKALPHSCAVLLARGDLVILGQNWQEIKAFRMLRGGYMPSVEYEGKIFYQRLDGEIFIFDYIYLYLSEIDISKSRDIGMVQPLKHGGKIYFLTAQNLFCLDGSSGNILWFSSFNTPSLPLDLCGFKDRIFVSFDDGSLLEFESFSGRVATRYDVLEGRGFYFRVFCKDIYYIAENGDLGVYFLGSGEVLWNLETEQLFLTKPECSGEDVLFVSYSGRLYSVNRWTGRINSLNQLNLNKVKYFESIGEYFIAVGGDGVFCVIEKN